MTEAILSVLHMPDDWNSPERTRASLDYFESCVDQKPLPMLLPSTPKWVYRTDNKPHEGMDNNDGLIQVCPNHRMFPMNADLHKENVGLLSTLMHLYYVWRRVLSSAAGRLCQIMWISLVQASGVFYFRNLCEVFYPKGWEMRASHNVQGISGKW